jgi:very-short-patch-repair endonuclease
MIERFGVANASASKVIKEKKRQTWLATYGVEHPFQSEAVKSKIEASMFIRHGVKSSMQSQKIRRKAREGMLSWTSKIERQFGELLQEKFQDVKVQIWVNDRCIDFYIPSIDTYMQFDGEYWHGLDRPLEMIAEGKTSRDVQIYKKWQTDREQDAWFKEHGMRLVRITDREFRHMGVNVLNKLTGVLK